MLELLIALLLAVTTAIVVLLDNTTAKEWLVEALPAWMQGIGTIGGVYLAWIAYRTWRRPDDARRQAEFAQSVIRASKHAQKAALDARYDLRSIVEHESVNINDRLELYDSVRKSVEFDMSDRTKALRRAIDELEVLEPEVSVFFGRGKEILVTELIDMYRVILDSHTLIERFDSEALMRVEEYDVNRVSIILQPVERALGLNALTWSEWEAHETNDPFKGELLERNRALVSAFAPYVIAESIDHYSK